MRLGRPTRSLFVVLKLLLGLVYLGPLVWILITSLKTNELVRREKLSLHPLRRNELSGIDVVKKGLRTVRFESKSNDPFIIFEAQPFQSRAVRTVRFRLKHDLKHFAQAQLFWTHATGEPFNEIKSVKVPLTPGKWVQYSIAVDAPDVREAWHRGAEIIHVRFDPVDMPGAFEMGPLEFLY